MMRCIITRFSLSVLIAGCASTPPTVVLPNGATGYLIDFCRSVEACEDRAQAICGSQDYLVHDQTEQRRTESLAASPDGHASRDGTWSTAGVHLLHDGNEIGRESRSESWWSLVAECNPKERPTDTPPDGSYAQALAEFIAGREKNKQIYMQAVCAVRDPELRRDELLLAKKEYEDQDLSCDDG